MGLIRKGVERPGMMAIQSPGFVSDEIVPMKPLLVVAT
jgi:hypothetical protein